MTTTVTLRVKEIAEEQGIDGPGKLKEFLGISRSMADRLWAGTPLPRVDKLATYARKFGRPMAELYSEAGTLPSGRQRQPRKNGHKVKAK